jgi:cell fate regulator YaaT (PSP1 superfamily)
MIREFIRVEVVPYELTNQEKLTFILKNESMINDEVMKGHKATNQDEFQPVREKIKKYRKDLGII